MRLNVFMLQGNYAIGWGIGGAIAPDKAMPHDAEAMSDHAEAMSDDAMAM